MENKGIKLSQLMASRLNHDYVAPLTAISNSCELMEISPSSQAECIELISQTVEASINLLQFYRLAFGSFGADETLSGNELQRLICNASSEQSARIEFHFVDNGLLRRDAKMVALAVLCIRSSFMKMDALMVKQSKGGWSFSGLGSGTHDDDGNIRCEDDWHGTAEPTANSIQFPLLNNLIEISGYQSLRKVTDNSLDLEITS